MCPVWQPVPKGRPNFPSSALRSAVAGSAFQDPVGSPVPTPIGTCGLAPGASPEKNVSTGELRQLLSIGVWSSVHQGIQSRGSAAAGDASEIAAAPIANAIRHRNPRDTTRCYQGYTVAEMDSSAAKVLLTNADKVLYPATGTTKGDVFGYYTAIAEAMLPHIAGRPVTRKRWPNGVEQSAFFEKQLASSAPDWLSRCTVTHRSGTTTYPVVDGPVRAGLDRSAGCAGSPCTAMAFHRLQAGPGHQAGIRSRSG